jgi:hypothetical protein
VRFITFLIILGIWVAQTGLVILFMAFGAVFAKIPFSWETYIHIKLVAYLLTLPLILFFRQVRGFFENLYYPTKKFDEPQPVYSHAEKYALDENYSAALQEYYAIAREYPHLAKPFMEMMNLYDLRFHDHDSVRKVYALALQTVKDKEQRKLLEHLYHDILGEEDKEEKQ